MENLTIAGGEKVSPTTATKKPQRGLITIGLIMVGLVLVRVGWTTANAVYQVPFLGKLFEVVGFGYTSWFVLQNLITAEARQKLWASWFSPRPEKSPTTLQPPPAPENVIAGVVGTVQVVIPLIGDVVDIATLRAKLEKSLNKAEAEAKSLSARLSNAKFVDKAPPEVVEGARASLAEAEKQAEILRDRLASLG